MSERFDVVVIGARCGGAPLATRLSRAGVRVLLLDADRLPSDMGMSNHFMQPPGMDMLDELGVGDLVRKAAPPTHTLRAELDGAGFTTQYPPGRPGYCIRRIMLDAWLQDAAVAAGAELRDQQKVTGLLREGNRVTGVVVKSGDSSYQVRARLVVGADGRHSTIARLTGVEEYLGFDMTRGGYWFYWPEPAAWKTDAYPYDALIAHVGEDMLIVFQCDGGLLVIAVVPPQGVARSWGGDYRQRYIDWLERCPLSAPLVRGNAPVGKGNGIVKARFFFRRPVGEGFALVGDAGLFMDYVTGQGMTDALYGGRDLATAILDGRPEAMQWYWRNRDATTLPLYYDAIRQGEVGINNGFGRMLYQRLGRDPEMSSRIARISDRQILPSQLVDPRTLARWTLSSVVRGPRGALRPFLRLGARVKKERQELARRRALLADAEKALRDAPPAARERHDSDVGAIDALAGE